MVAAFVQHQARAARVQHLEFSRQQGRLLGLQHQRAAGEQGHFIAAQVVAQVHFVDLGQLRLRRNDPVQQATIVGQQQQATGIAVEAADRGQHRVAVAEARRQQVVDQAAGVLGRAAARHQPGSPRAAPGRRRTAPRRRHRSRGLRGTSTAPACGCHSPGWR
ncbi:hypothetical protein G6F60_013973 [Rhizopus arrhizus]|nr:hypothetical protein G6F60_013973 [Rhizopus arrhizus]